MTPKIMLEYYECILNVDDCILTFFNMLYYMLWFKKTWVLNIHIREIKFILYKYLLIKDKVLWFPKI